ncbi:MAG TPA: hypothetical protein VF585_02885 [Chthoniobacterales bacterium]|jgi:hypothetical protein
MNTDPNEEQIENLHDVEEGGELEENTQGGEAGNQGDKPAGDVPTWDQPESGTREH